MNHKEQAKRLRASIRPEMERWEQALTGTAYRKLMRKVESMSDDALVEAVVAAMNAVEMRGQGADAFERELAEAAIAACRPAIRAEALEEAASKADYWRKNYRLGETKRVRFDRRDMNSVISGTAQCIAEDIRALKVLAK